MPNPYTLLLCSKEFGGRINESLIASAAMGACAAKDVGYSDIENPAIRDGLTICPTK
jgi:hypothetical protein